MLVSISIAMWLTQYITGAPATKLEIVLATGRPPDGHARYRIRVKGSTPNLLCKPLVRNDRLQLQIILPRDADRKLVIHIPGDHWVFLENPDSDQITLPRGTVLNLDPGIQQAYEYADDLGKSRRLTLFDTPGEYEFIFSRDMDTDWEEIIPEAYCPVDFTRRRETSLFSLSPAAAARTANPD